MRATAVIAALLLPLLLGGCYESPDIEIYEPGVYKGGEDPLRDKLDQPELQSELYQRLQRGQTDR